MNKTQKQKLKKDLIEPITSVMLLCRETSFDNLIDILKLHSIIDQNCNQNTIEIAYDIYKKITHI